MQEQLSNKLASLRQRLYEHTLRLTVAARSSDRDMLNEAQASIDKVWAEWDALVLAVAQLESVNYNSVAVLAMSQEDDE